MALFEVALARVLRYEGGYSNNPADAGGETVAGISRRYNGNWPGWLIVDRLTRTGKGVTLGDENADLRQRVREFYEARYWSPGFADLPQLVANKLLDASVLLGLETAVDLLQRALNLLNRNATSWPEIEEDGRLGPVTLACVEKADPADLLRMYCALWAGHCIDRMRARPINETFARGWLARALAP